MGELVARPDDEVFKVVFGHEVIKPLGPCPFLVLSLFHLRLWLQLLVDAQGDLDGLAGNKGERLPDLGQEVLRNPIAEKFVGHLQQKFSPRWFPSSDGLDPGIEVLSSYALFELFQRPFPKFIHTPLTSRLAPPPPSSRKRSR